MKNLTKLLTIASALALALLAGCGSSGGSDDKSDEAKSKDWHINATASSQNKDLGFGTYAIDGDAEDVDGSNAVISFEITEKQDYETGYTRQVDEMLEAIASDPAAMAMPQGSGVESLGWAKLTIDNTDGRMPHYSGSPIFIITKDGDKVTGVSDAATQLALLVIDEESDEGESLIDDETMAEVEKIADLDDEDPVLPGTKKEYAVLLDGPVESIKSVWLQDMELERSK